jgi:hypothetical protein
VEGLKGNNSSITRPDFGGTYVENREPVMMAGLSVTGIGASSSRML